MKSNTSLTDVERQTLINQFRILALLDKKESKSYNHKADIIEHGYTGLYGDVFEFDEELSPTICQETYQILLMFRYINNVIPSLTATQKASIDLNRMKFEGFDMNNDRHYFYFAFLKKQGDYKEFEKRNSHTMGSMMKYKRMLPIFETFLARRSFGGMTFSDLQEFDKALK